MVPNGWEVKSFSELLKSNDVEKIQDGNHGNSHPKSSDFVDSGIPFVMARDLKNGTVDLENCAYITKEQADSLRIGFAKTGDILLSHKGTVGLVAIVPLCDEYMMLTPQVTYYRIPQDSSLMSSYLYQFLLSHEYQSRFKNLAFQSTRSYLGITAQKELSINLPPLPEQQKIAKILSTWDKAISTTERLIENSTQQKKALMQQLLTGKKRLLDDSGKRFEGEWEEVKLTEVAQITMGSSPKSEAYNEVGDGLPLLQGNADIKNRKSVPRIYTSQITKECHVDDILFSVRAPVGTVALSNHHACIGRGIAAIKAKENHSQDYLYQWLLSFELKWERYSQGSTFEAVNSNDIKSLNLSVPNLKEQQKIATVLTNADKEIELLEQQLADLQQEKKALMQVLLTGKKRVVVDGAF